MQRSESSTADFVCHCGKRFTRIENLKRHQRLHSGTSTRDCPFCGRTFSRNDVLQRHLKTHEGHQVDDTESRMSPAPRPNRGRSRSATEQIQTVQSVPLLVTPQEQDFVSELLAPPGHNASTQAGPGYTAQQDEALRILNGLLAATQPVSAPIPTFDQPLSSNPFSDLFNNQTLMQWDDGMLWSMQDQAPLQDFDWALFGISPQGTNEQEALPTPGDITIPPSRAATPPVDQAGDAWPTNHQPRPFVVGSSGRLEEVTVDPADIPALNKWSRFWLDKELYEKVITSLASAWALPNNQAFVMPSSLFTVNTLISHYFDKFLPQLPILHVPTFQISSAPPLLIASFMMMGACLSKIKGARPFSVDLIEIIRRTLSNLFEMDSMNLRNVDLLHVSLLNSFAGLWSGHQRSFELAELSRGMLINLCRRTRLLESTIGNEHRPITTSATDSLALRWQKWIHAESRKRLGLAIFIFDSLFPAFFDLPSYLSQGEMRNTVLPCDDRFWNAPYAQAWQAQLGVAPIPPAPYFALGVTGVLVPKYATDAPSPVQHLNPLASLCVLTALHHHIWEFRSQLSVYMSLGVEVPFGEPVNGGRQPREVENGFEGRKVWLEDALSTWKQEYYDESDDNPLSQGGRVLHHLAFIALNSDVRDLFAVSGKFGPHQTESVLPGLRHWVNSSMSVRSASHAIRLLKVLSFPVHIPSIFAPISVFIAVLTLWVFTSINSPNVSSEHQISRLEPEDREQLLKLFPSSVNLPDTIIRSGVRYLGACREWRIGAAMALVLAKTIESRSAA